MRSGTNTRRPALTLTALFSSFEMIAREVVRVPIGPRAEAVRRGLVHPVHQQVRVVGWEIQPKA